MYIWMLEKSNLYLPCCLQAVDCVDMHYQLSSPVLKKYYNKVEIALTIPLVVECNLGPTTNWSPNQSLYNNFLLGGILVGDRDPCSNHDTITINWKTSDGDLFDPIEISWTFNSLKCVSIWIANDLHWFTYFLFNSCNCLN